jgi:hypothetical protein
MASPAIRQWFIDLVTRLVPEAPFQETDGVLTNQKALPEVWSTFEFDMGANQRLSIGREYIEREYGTCTVLFLIKAGRGPMIALNIAQSFADKAKALYQEDIKEASGVKATARLDNVGPPNSEPYEDGNWLVCSVACVYTYDAIRGRVLIETLPVVN